MIILEYLEVLKNEKKSWLFRKDNIEERLDALAKIMELGTPSTIHYLIPFLKDNKKEIQLSVCNVIAQLFRRIEMKRDYYFTLKYCDISEADVDYYMQTFSNDQLLVLLAIATLNRSGYVRKKAVDALAATKNEKAIPFIVYRLADWVKPVRACALNALDSFRQPMFINSLVDNLSVFEWLQEVKRTDLSAIYTDIMNFVMVESKQYVVKNFKSFSDKTRLLIAKQLANAEIILPDDLRLLLTDKHFLVRGFALMHFDKLSEHEVNNLLNDKSSKIRIQTLYKLKSSIRFTELVYPFLADDSAIVREFVRYSLKEQQIDFAAVYNSNLQNNHFITGSLSGLAEKNGIQFKESILPFLSDKKIKVRKIAF